MDPMARTSETRERVLDTSARIFRQQGYAATGLKQIVSEGRAPFGSLYHFFPGGKQQIGVEALTRAGERYERLVDRVFERSKNPAAAALAWFELAAEALAQSDYAEGCPIGTVAAEVASTNEALRLVCAEMFESWQTRLTVELIGDGVSRRDAKELASFALSALEGAYVLSRVARNIQPLKDSGKRVAAAIRAAPRRRSERGKKG
jgi:AcrR family transcriptional regulator